MTTKNVFFHEIEYQHKIEPSFVLSKTLGFPSHAKEQHQLHNISIDFNLES